MNYKIIHYSKQMVDDEFVSAFTRYYNICSDALNSKAEIVKKRVWWSINDIQGETPKTYRKVRTDNGEIYSHSGVTSIGNIYDNPTTTLDSGLIARKEKRKNGWVKKPTIPIPENHLPFEESLEKLTNEISKIRPILETKTGKVWVTIRSSILGLNFDYAKVRSDTGEVYTSAGVKPIGSIYSDDYKTIMKELEKKKKN